MDNTVNVLADEFGSGPSQHPFSGGIDECRFAFRIYAVNAFARGSEDQLVLAFDLGKHTVSTPPTTNPSAHVVIGGGVDFTALAFVEVGHRQQNKGGVASGNDASGIFHAQFAFGCVSGRCARPKCAPTSLVWQQKSNAKWNKTRYIWRYSHREDLRLSIDSAENTQLSILAEEIRHFRKKGHFSLEMLAEVSGVSRSMISKIERCETVPSTVILSKLAEALGVTFSQLMAPEIEREIVHIPASRQPVLKDDESGFLRRCISPVLPGRGIDWVLNTLPPNAETGNFVPHRRGVEEYIYVLRGRMRVTIGSERVILNQADSLYFQADTDHSFLNLGKTPCEYFLVIDTSKVR